MSLALVSRAAVLSGALVLVPLAHADEQAAGLACNQLCRAWMRLGEAAPPVPPAAVPDTAVTGPVALHPAEEAPAVQPGLSDRLRAPAPPANAAAPRTPTKRVAASPPKSDAVSNRSAHADVPLPPVASRPVRAAVATPFGVVSPIDPLVRVAVGLPIPPPVPMPQFAQAVAPAQVRLAPPVQAPLDPPATASAEGSNGASRIDLGPTAQVAIGPEAIPAPPQPRSAPAIQPAVTAINAVDTPPVRVASEISAATGPEQRVTPPIAAAPAVATPAIATELPVGATPKAQRGWPPPIDVIGAILTDPSLLRAKTAAR